MKPSLSAFAVLALLSACTTPPELSANWFVVARDSDCNERDPDERALCEKVDPSHSDSKMRMKLALLNRSADWIEVKRLRVNPPVAEREKDAGWIWPSPPPGGADASSPISLASGELLVVDLEDFKSGNPANGGGWSDRCRIPIHVEVSLSFPYRKLSGEVKEERPTDVALPIRNPMPTALPDKWDICPRPKLPTENKGAPPGSSLPPAPSGPARVASAP